MKQRLAALAACVGVCFVFMSSAHASTPNTTAAGAVSYEVGAGWVTDGVDETSQNRWFAFKELAGRSYCVEAALGPATYFPLDPNLTLYSDSAGTVVYLSNADGVGEPPQNKGSRVCYQSALAVGASTVRLFNVNVPVTTGSGDSGFVRTRVVDTTLIFPMLNLQNNGTGAAGVRSVKLSVTNTTTVNVNATLYVPGYGAIATLQLTAPNASLGTGFTYQNTIFPPCCAQPTWIWIGTVYLTHDGPPGALEAWADTQDPLLGSTVRFFGLPR